MRFCPKENMPETPDVERYLNQVLEDISSTFDDRTGINHVEGPNLPSEKEITEILHKVLEIIFPGFLGKRNFSLSTIKYSIGELLTEIYFHLFDQVSRAYRLACEMEDCENCDIPDKSDKAVKALLNAIADIREAMKLDVKAAMNGDPAAKSLDEIVLSYPGIKAITVQRIAHVLYIENVPLIPRMMCEHAHSSTGIDIHPGAELGKGIFIDHGTGVVIGETAEIGRNVKIYQGVTLGALSFPKDACGNIIRGRKRHPKIEEKVTIYSGATILGDITIGENSVIGGNVWLTESLPAGTKIMIAPPKQTIKSDKK